MPKIPPTYGERAGTATSARVSLAARLAITSCFPYGSNKGNKKCFGLKLGTTEVAVQNLATQQYCKVGFENKKLNKNWGAIFVNFASWLPILVLYLFSPMRLVDLHHALVYTWTCLSCCRKKVFMSWVGVAVLSGVLCKVFMRAWTSSSSENISAFSCFATWLHSSPTPQWGSY